MIKQKTMGQCIGKIGEAWADLMVANRHRVEILKYEKEIGIACSIKTMKATNDLIDSAKALRMHVQVLIDKLEGHPAKD